MQWFTSVEGTANGAGWLIRVRARAWNVCFWVCPIGYAMRITRLPHTMVCVSLRVFTNETRAAQSRQQGSHVSS